MYNIEQPFEHVTKKLNCKPIEDTDQSEYQPSHVSGKLKAPAFFMWTVMTLIRLADARADLIPC